MGVVRAEICGVYVVGVGNHTIDLTAVKFAAGQGYGVGEAAAEYAVNHTANPYRSHAGTGRPQHATLARAGYKTAPVPPQKKNRSGIRHRKWLAKRWARNAGSATREGILATRHAGRE